MPAAFSMCNVYIVRSAVALSIYTTSFDIFLVVNIGGFNFRFTQLAILPVILLWFAEEVIANRRMKMPYACGYLLIWNFFQFIFSLRSPNLKNAFGYDAWLCFNITEIFAVTYYAAKAYDNKWLLRTYINSFVFMSFVGLCQMALYAIGINFYVQQFWNSRLARINGFSYEPSYYATYLLLGYIFTSYLLFVRNRELFSIRKLRRKHFIITLALLLSSSRMGWLMCTIWIIYKFLSILKELFPTGLIEKKRFMMLFSGLLLFFSMLSILIFILYKYDLKFFFNGLGLFGQSSHSSSERIGGLKDSLEIFKASPILGYGLGGVDPMMAEYLGIQYTTEINGLATSVAAELLIATGGIATIFILLYFYKLQGRSFITVKIRYSNIIKALIFALNFELMILIFNQNILRPYLWMHLAIMGAAYKLLKTYRNLAR